MSEIRATTISNSAGTGPITLTKQAALKVWMNMTGTGTIAINDSLNVSSASDLGTGNYQVFYTSSMSNVNYSVGTSGAASTAGSANDGKNIGSYTQYNLVGSAGISCFNSVGNAYEDPTRAMLQNAGDLA